MSADPLALQRIRHATRKGRTAMIKDLEKEHAGMQVISEPFIIGHPDKGKKRVEIAACKTMWLDMLKGGIRVVCAKRDGIAYLLREKDGMHTSNSEKLKSFALKTRGVLGSSMPGRRRA